MPVLHPSQMGKPEPPPPRPKPPVSRLAPNQMWKERDTGRVVVVVNPEDNTGAAVYRYADDPARAFRSCLPESFLLGRRFDFLSHPAGAK